ncbi:MAG: hypothetical protein ACK52I_31715, partial [Pseudomonadota bacterium]
MPCPSWSDGGVHCRRATSFGKPRHRRRDAGRARELTTDACASDDAPMQDYALLGPQYRDPNLRDCLAGLGVHGRLVTITAGWQEREGEIDELRSHVGAAHEVVDLGLYVRTQQVYADDPALAGAYRERQELLQELQEHYVRRLRALQAAEEELNALPGEGAALRLARRAALGDIRRLDRQHLAAIAREHAAFTREWHPGRRASLMPHVTEIRREMERAAAVLIAGGHVAVLLNRLRLFAERG